MRLSLVVPVVQPRQTRLKMYGSIGDRPSTPKLIAASGKNFISVESAEPHGGPGVAIAHRQSGVVG
jgi:hypothetical protein